MSHTSSLARSLLILLICLCSTSTLLVRPSEVRAQEPQPGLIGAEAAGGQGVPPITLASTINGVQIGFAREYNKTSIWARVCADSPNFQLRSEAVGRWITELFNRTANSGGCSPSTTSWWRMLYNADPGPQVFRIYATANDTMLSDAEFMQRAARADCIVTGYGIGTCTPSTSGGPVFTPPPFSATRGVLDTPPAGTNIGDVLEVAGWVVDAGSWSGVGINQVEVLINGTSLGFATYGGERPDVATYLGDSRFRNSHFSFSTSTGSLPKGPVTLQIRYRSALTGAVSTLERQISIATSVNIPPSPPTLTAPDIGATVTAATVTLQVQDTGDPDNGPSQARTFLFRVAKADGTWAQESGPQSSTSWAVTLPSPGAYQWQAQSNDGAANSEVSGPQSFTFSSAERILNVRYVDQVFAQRLPINRWWLYCGPSSLSMLLHYYGVEKRDVFTNRAPTAELAREMRVGMKGTPSGAIPAALRSRGLAFTTKGGAVSAAELKASIDSGHPVVFSLNSYNHILVLIGYRANGNFVVHDPFGGRFWPQQWSQTANRNDAPWTASFETPRTRGATLPNQGQYIEYSYSELVRMGFTWTLRVTGTSKPLQLASATINPGDGVLTGEQIRVRFGKAGTAALSALSSINVTYAPRFSAEQPTDAYAGALAAFSLSAVDDADTLLSGLAEPFTIQIDLDSSYVENLTSGGGVTGDDSRSTEVAPTTRPIEQSVVMARWDEAASAWVELPTSIDAAAGHATAQSNQFGDFALLVKPDTLKSYLPAVVR